MCLLAIAHCAHPKFACVLIANRDEFHARAAAPLATWPEAANLAGGRDLHAGGTWLLARTDGALAALTNVRAVPKADSAEYSRGALPVAALSAASIPTFWQNVRAERGKYGPFNLLLRSATSELMVYHSPEDRLSVLPHGVYGLSNADLDSPWPKLQRARSALTRWCAHAEDSLMPLWQALSDTWQPDDAQLPNTGVGLALERFLAPAFIRAAQQPTTAVPQKAYGTRASTIVLIDNSGYVQIHERSFGADGAETGSVRLSL